ncbi:dimethylarginine dimethylaminohydrolase family protein [candidate division KSB1 bacterium]
MLRNEGGNLNKVVICSPESEYFNLSDIKSHNFGEIPDKDNTIRQFKEFKSFLIDFGAEVVDIPELSGHPNSVFTRDVSLSTPEGYITLRMGLETRRGEEKWMSEVLSSLDEPELGEIKPPGTIEGGDIILAGDVAFVGLSHRTNEEGIKQLTAFLEPMGYKIRTASVKGRYLHIGGAMSSIGHEKIVYCSEVFPDGFFKGFDAVEVPNLDFNPSVGNVICLRDNEILANSAENEITMEILDKHDVKVHGIDLSEFRKGTGGPTCLILPVSRE